MNKYGLVAIKAVRMLESGEKSDPSAAWSSAAADVFVDSPSSQNKGCPKNAFIGLCEEGLVRGVHAGKYAARKGEQKNKDYALKAVQILRKRPEMAEGKDALWAEIMEGVEKKHNSQMDVVLALWVTELLHVY